MRDYGIMCGCYFKLMLLFKLTVVALVDAVLSVGWHCVTVVHAAKRFFTQEVLSEAPKRPMFRIVYGC